MKNTANIKSPGALLGVYATTNGGSGAFKTYVSDWNYAGQGQVVD